MVAVMILDCIELRETPGCGVGLYTTRELARGAIVMMECSRCSKISQADARRSSHWAFINSHAPITRWSYPDFLEPCDKRMYYGNHSCNANTLDTHLGFDIAIRDLAPGTELTFDYRRFLDPTIDFDCCCREPDCGGRIRCLQPQPDLDALWNARIRGAIEQLSKVDQPLLKTPLAISVIRAISGAGAANFKFFKD